VPQDDTSRARIDQDDRELVRRSCSGNEAAFTSLVGRYAASLVNLAFRILRDHDEAQDVSQESFIKAHDALARYDPAYPFRVWLFRIAHNTAIDHLRRRRGGMVSLDAPRRVGDAEVEWELVDESTPAPDAGAAGRDRTERLDRAIARLPPSLRAAIVLRHVEDLTYDEIATALNVPLGTVKIRIHRGREALARLLKREHVEGELE